MSPAIPSGLTLAVVAEWPLQGLVPPEHIQPAWRDRPEHPAPWTRLLCAELARRHGVRVEVFSETRRVRRLYRAQAGGVQVSFVPKTEPGRTDPWLLFRPAVWRLRRLLRGLRPDLVHGHGTEQTHGLAAVDAFSPAVLTLHGLMEKLHPYVDWPSWRKKLWRRMERRAVRRAAAVVSPSGFAAEWARRIHPAARVRRIPNICPPEFFSVRPEFSDRLVLCIGGLSRIKGTDTVLKAVRALRDPAVRVVFSGWVGSAADYPGLARELGVDGQVEFAGTLSAERLRALMKQARAVVLGSRMDNAPNVVLEAHAAGLPVVSTRVGGIPEMIEDGRDGWLVEAEDAEALAGRMKTLLDDPEAGRRMGAAGRERVAKDNSPEAVAAAHLAVYADVLGREVVS